eukprot:CAMPEP_0172311274 /NCGR_PEP_ID=MMETSP1058-20130122/14451_1 /TAXON_ID=83371 /ORGANISM="Detonula confervacea, Strain CCMP 353" /LENGTH=208 /DNA_ID=CAMNT_0013024413 /DNA_START=243 /DNA_END=869 /DNA_ORIENTATION=+
MSPRIISVSKDGTTSRFYKQGCENIAKKSGRCDSSSHGVTRKLCSVDGCPSTSQKGGLCRRHHRAKESTPLPLESEGEDSIGDGELLEHAVSNNRPALFPYISNTLDLNLTEDEELLGDFIYNSSRTAKLLRAKKEDQSSSFAKNGMELHRKRTARGMQLEAVIERAANTAKAKMKKMEEEQIERAARAVFALATTGLNTAALSVDNK